MIEVRGIERHEVPAFRAAVSFGFGSDVLPDSELTPQAVEGFVDTAPVATMLVAVDGGRFVATFASRDFDLALPGGASVPMAGATMVTVQPTHRRRGLLTELMKRHLALAAERGQILAGLRASEETIYGRFGYGSAAPCYALRLPAETVAVPPPADAPGGQQPSLRLVGADEAATLLPPAYDRHWRCVPGLLSRSPAWWRERLFRDPEHRRRGATARRHVVAERDGAVTGWASYRQRDIWTTGRPDGSVEVEDFHALDDQSRRALWHYLSHVDLYPNLAWDQCPLDDPIFLEVDRPRRLVICPHDTLWLRLLDPVRAFEARRYERDGAVTLAVTDPVGMAAGTWRLLVAGGEGRCRPTAEPAEVTLDSRAAGAAYLGGVPLLTLARAGWAEGTADAVARLDGMFRTARAPWSPEYF